ncbi:hypothetical protein QN239_27910 [Mycolicibacterium sp. Y3]
MTNEHTKSSAAKERWGTGRSARLAFVVVGILLAITTNLGLREMRHEQAAPAAAAEQEPTSLVVGECVVVGAGADTAGSSIEHSDCAVDPSYTVAAVYEGDQECAGPNYADHAWIVGGKPARRVCLVQNLAAGHCYRVSQATAVINHVDCAAGSGGQQFRVVDRTDSLNAGPCPDGVVAYTYPVPPRTYCLATDSPVPAEP